MAPLDSTLLTSDEHAPAAARSFIRAHLEQLDLTDLVEDAELLVSELVTNSVVHTASSSVAVELHRPDDGRLRCVVVDRATDTAPTVQDPDLRTIGGRGLLIVEAVARRWGVDRRPSETAVWFELSCGST